MGSGKSQGPAARRKKPARAKRATPRAGTATAPPASPPAEAEFPVAAIGASAGGLEAVSELLRAVPPAPGLALVLVQHLDPDHASVLAEILGRTTTLPVQTVEDGAPIRPDAVFVIPPNHGLELADGHFRLTPRDVAAGRPMPVDQFFHSLADTYRTRAIGVVLSGTNSDGALGLQAIKAEGGIAIAQTPDSARFPEMPRAALSEGPVDFVLAPGEIGRELAAVAVRMRTPLARDTPQALQSGKDAEQLSRIFSLLRSETRVDFSLYRETTIRRRITRRLILNQVASLEDYVGLLRRNRKELRALYDDLLITVTAFFRDPETYQILSAKVFPQILKHKNPETPIRIWVPGCATGEEVYSLAISLFEALQGSAAPPPVQIFGTDISELAVEKARAGLYLENSLVNVSPERMRAFFRKSDGGYQISKRLRDVCVFARQNVASDPPFSNIDLLSCRNLLIYLEPALQRRVMPLFHYALQPTGFLVLGPAESVGLLTDLFQPIDQGHRIFAKKAGAVNYFQYRGPRAAAAGSQAQPQVAPSISMRTPGDVAREADRIVLGRYAPPGVVVDENLQIVQFRGRTTPYLEPAPGAASLQLDRMARNGLGIELRRMIEKARRTGERVRRTSVPLGREAGEIAEVHVEVVPMGGDDGPAYFLVLFEEPPRKEKPRRSRPEPRRAAAGDQRLKRLESELAVTKEYLQSIIEEQEVSNEELKSANEEILSSNEELQSTNEELETAKEELQSTNEELRTVNDELQNRNVELTDVSNDLVNLFHSINVAIVMVGARGEVRRFTAMAEKLLNLRPTDVGRPLSELRPNLKGPDLAPLVSEVIETMNVRERELQDSEGHWYFLRARPYRTVDDRIDGAVLVFQDIDPLKKSLEHVTQARFYAEALVETVHESLIVLAPDLRLVTANKAFYATFQTTPLQTDGRPLFELDGWEWAEARLRGVLERVAEGGELVRNLEVEAISRRYGRRILLVSARQVDVPGEQKRAVLLAIEDITERRAGEKDLRASERRYRQIFEFAREGIWILDGETGEIRDVNPFLAELLGWTAGDLVGRKPWDLPIYESPEEARAVFEEARTRGFAFHPVVRMRKSDGAIIDVEELSTIYAEGADRLVQSNLRDISERRRLEEELRQAQKMDSIGRLAGGLAHDFNNILNIITAYVGLLERGVDAEKEKETLIGIQKAVQRGAAVVRQLLTFARRDETSLRAVDVNDVVREVAAMAKETFPKRTAIELELGSDLPKITADPNHLHQALLNLCVNSRDAIPNKGRITLSTAAVAGEELRRRFADATADRYVRASVADTGDGMPEETRSRIFEPFFTTKGKGEGSGLGLPVVYGIVKNHSGWIDVASEPGKGTTVSLYFPARAEGAGQEREKTEVRSKRQKAGGGEKLMVVDDEKMILDSSRALLEAEGYRVVAAADGEEAVEVFARDGRDVALVLLDLELPRLSGVEVLRRMRQINPAIRFLVTSGRVGSAEQAAIEHAPVLRKPFTADDLLAAIRSALEPRPSPRRRPARGVPASPPG